MKKNRQTLIEYRVKRKLIMQPPLQVDFTIAKIFYNFLSREQKADVTAKDFL